MTRARSRSCRHTGREHTFFFFWPGLPAAPTRSHTGGGRQSPLWRRLRENPAEGGAQQQQPLGILPGDPLGPGMQKEGLDKVEEEGSSQASDSRTTEVGLSRAKGRAGFTVHHVTSVVTQGPVLQREPQAWGLKLCRCHL